MGCCCVCYYLLVLVLAGAVLEPGGGMLLCLLLPVGVGVGWCCVGARWWHADVSVLFDVLVHAEGAGPLVEHLGPAPAATHSQSSSYLNLYNKRAF